MARKPSWTTRYGSPSASTPKELIRGVAALPEALDSFDAGPPEVGSGVGGEVEDDDLLPRLEPASAT
jgi:hypothetical protein